MNFCKKSSNNGVGPSSDISRLCCRTRIRSLSVTLLALVAVGNLLALPSEAVTANSSETAVTAPAQESPPQDSVINARTDQADTGPDNSAPDNEAPAGTVQDTTAAEISPEGENPFTYNSNIPLSSELQQYLFDLCAQRNLDYKMCLAIIKHESNFNAKALGGGSNYGFFQINKCNHKKLSSTLKTANKPFDAETNINWGTYILSCLFDKYAESYTGENLLKAVLSAYNRGEGGFAKNGFAKAYIKGYYKALAIVDSWFE